MGEGEAKTRYRAIFLSDLHLGMRNCQAEALIDFLRDKEADTYYLVGDIVDFWKFRRGLHWSQAANDVCQKLLRKVRKGARIIYIPGNHDHGLRAYVGSQFGGITIERDAIHESASGQKYLVMHGDEFDAVMVSARWLAFLGDRAYDFALWLNNPVNHVRRWFGFDRYWSLSSYAKQKVKGAVNFISGFETLLSEEAKRRGADGVICGHIHQAASRRIDGVHYLNCGDWVESCTAIAETYDGAFLVLHHEASPHAVRALVASPPVLAETAA